MKTKTKKEIAWKRIEEIEEYLKDKYLDAYGGWLDEMLEVYPEYKEEYNELLKIIGQK